MTKTLRVLIVEDSQIDADLILREIRQAGYDVESLRVETRSTMQSALAGHIWDVILCDYSMTQFSVLAALETLKASGRDLPFIIISGTIGEEAAVTAIKAGANDYLLKGKLTRLVSAIERELRDADVRRSQREAESRYQLLVEHLPIIVYVNPAWPQAPPTISPSPST